jgi:hypothetical protein
MSAPDATTWTAPALSLFIFQRCAVESAHSTSYVEIPLTALPSGTARLALPGPPPYEPGPS